jgi:uncharacterized glyoxalase superfamily protein PhnB
MLLAACALAQTEEEPMASTTFKKLTPVLYVERIEPCLDFWVGRLGFEKTVEVPEGDALGFVILQRDGVEVMLQSYASLEKDIPAFGEEARRSTNFLFVEVTDFEDVARRGEGLEVVLPRRKTFYGATEIGVREPGGHVVVFASFD